VKDIDLVTTDQLALMLDSGDVLPSVVLSKSCSRKVYATLG